MVRVDSSPSALASCGLTLRLFVGHTGADGWSGHVSCVMCSRLVMCHVSVSRDMSTQELECGDVWLVLVNGVTRAGQRRLQ